MKTKWLHNNSKEKCILFFNGWSCDETPFSQLLSEEYDVLMCYDYRDILQSKEIKRLFENYEEIYLLAWSLGVYVANLLMKDRKNLFADAIAINGTVHPIDNLKGIPPAVFQGTISGLNEKNLEKFWMRMCGGKSAYQHFHANLPKRDLDDQLKELLELQSIIQNHFTDWSIYNKALIGNKDFIFSADNQRNAWSKDTVSIERDYPHYCFDNWNTWDEIIEDLSCGKSEDK
jgi:biotin synthesis protein BioG